MQTFIYFGKRPIRSLEIKSLVDKAVIITAILAFASPLGARPIINVSHNIALKQPNSQTLWLTEKWTANEKPFLLARQEVEQQVQSKRDLIKMATKYGALSQKKPNDATLLYRWGLATYYVTRQQNFVWHPPLVDKMLSTLASFPSPHSMQFARMRFLVETSYIGNPNLKAVGLRLWHYEPHNEDLMVALLYDSDILASSANAQLALRIAQQMVQEHPQEAAAYRRLGGVYIDLSIRDNKRAICEDAITSLQTYLRLAKTNDPDRAFVLNQIAVMQRTMPAK